MIKVIFTLKDKKEIEESGNKISDFFKKIKGNFPKIDFIYTPEKDRMMINDKDENI